MSRVGVFCITVSAILSPTWPALRDWVGSIHLVSTLFTPGILLRKGKDCSPT